MKYWKWVFGLHNNSKYYVRKGTSSNLRDKSRKDIAIIAWFDSLKESVDKMPDTNVWQLTAPFRKDVYQW